jgi:predicted secreted acid phosphatase
LDNSGKISNQEIRLQDNYYYQAYSYVINTMQEERDYSKIMELTHVAGTKRFSNLVKEVDYTFNFVSSRTNSMEQIIISDFVASSDSISMA